jgi:hypothetical protein
MWAFSDESERANRMILAVVSARPSDVHAARATMRGLLLPGQRRIHMSDESPRRRRVILDAVADLDGLAATVFTLRRPMGHTRAQGRALLLGAATRHLVDSQVTSWILDNQHPAERDRDRAAIAAVLRTCTPKQPLTYDHRRAHSEPMLWTADSVCWAFGAGGHWRQRIAHVINLRNIDP